MRARALLAIVIIFSLLSVVAFAKDRYAPKANWRSLKEGMEAAKAEKKPIIVDFAVPEGCPRCDFLERNVYGSDEVVWKINSDFVPILIDLSKKLTPEEKALGDKYDFKNDCLLLFLDNDGRIIKDPLGRTMCFIDKVEPEVFIDYLEYVKTKYVPSK